jgi:glycosyltransferase involved in cell wall biosynthesis
MIEHNGWPWTVEGVIDFTSKEVNQWPKISIVTPSYNQGIYIEETIRSIILQGYPNLEYIIMDGGSQDNSVNIIKKYEPWISYWVSEKDQGQSDAINKGWKRATGDLFAWLNSDDYYFPDTLFSVASTFINNGRKPAVIAGPVYNVDEDGTIVKLIAQRNLNFENMVKYWNGKRSFHQPGIFFPGNFNRDCDQFVDPDLKYAMDYDLLCKTLQKVPVLYVQNPLTNFRLHDQSKTISQQELMLQETSLVSRRYWRYFDNIDISSHDRHLIRELIKLSFHNFFIGEISKGFGILEKAVQVNKSIAFIEIINILIDKIKSRTLKK